MGRYPEADPIGLAGGMNGYRYAMDNPFKFVDPRGTQAVPAPWFTPMEGAINGAMMDILGSLNLILSLSGDTPQDGSQTQKAGSSSGCDNSACAALVSNINSLVSELKGRYYEIIENKLNLPASGPFSVGGHQMQFTQKQANLRKLLVQSAAQGCSGYSPDAWDWATRPVSSPQN